MNTNPLIAVPLLWTVCTLSVSCFAAIVWALFPERATLIRESLRENASRAFVVGLLNVACYVVVILLMHRSGMGKVAGGLLLLWTSGLAASGLPGAAALLGERLLHHASSPGSTMRAVFVGTWVLGYATMLPWLGWSLLLAFVLTCFGAGLTAFLQSMRQPAV